MLVVYLWEGESLNGESNVCEHYVTDSMVNAYNVAVNTDTYRINWTIHSRVHLYQGTSKLYSDLLFDTYVPDLQSLHPPSLYFPGTHADEHACGWSAGLLRNCPPVHVLSVHAELSVSVEYLPDPHG